MAQENCVRSSLREIKLRQETVRQACPRIHAEDGGTEIPHNRRFRLFPRRRLRYRGSRVSQDFVIRYSPNGKDSINDVVEPARQISRFLSACENELATTPRLASVRKKRIDLVVIAFLTRKLTPECGQSRFPRLTFFTSLDHLKAGSPKAEHVLNVARANVSVNVNPLN